MKCGRLKGKTIEILFWKYFESEALKPRLAHVARAYPGFRTDASRSQNTSPHFVRFPQQFAAVPGLETGPLAPGTNALTIRPLRLPKDVQNKTVQYRNNINDAKTYQELKLTCTLHAYGLHKEITRVENHQNFPPGKKSCELLSITIIFATLL